MEGSAIVSRRALLASAASGVVGMALCTEQALAEPASPDTGDALQIGKDGDPDAQYGFLMNVQRCINCKKCVEACRRANGTPKSLPARRKITAYAIAKGREHFISTSCMHCEKPSCVTVCPAGAISKDVGGIVLVDKELCIGCKYCYEACPFEAPHYDGTSMYKCDYCFGAGVALGDTPACVRACKVQALRYGKLDDLLALSNRTRRIEGPTEPAGVVV